MPRRFRPSREGFAVLLLELRRNKGVFQFQIAHAIGVSVSTVSLWEQGKRVPREETAILSLAQYLDAGDRTDELLTAAGFGLRPPLPALGVVSRLDEFLGSPQFSERSKAELTGLMGDLIKVFELREMVFEDVPSEERPALQELVRSLTKLPSNKRSQVIKALNQLVEGIS